MQILSNREAANRAVIAAAERGDVVTVKANVVGADKNVAEAFLIVRHFAAYILQNWGGVADFFMGDDGIRAIITGCGSPAEQLKLQAVKLEKSHPIGRFADIDVYKAGSAHSLSRGYMRQCFLCQNPAFVCARLQTHPPEQLIGLLKSSTRAYFSKLIYELTEQSLMAELNLCNKFGLVSPVSNGSHADLNYGVMCASQKVIIPYLVKLFWLGAESTDPQTLLARLRPVGEVAERAMFAEAGVNTYKGFIFIGGLLLGGAGYSLTHGGSYGGIFTAVRLACRDITSELPNQTTFGAQAFKKYNFTGARGQAQRGLPTVKKAAAMLGGDLSQNNLLKTLCFITGEIEDTVLLKRARSLERYDYFKRIISSADVTCAAQLKAINDECVQNGVSIGGSADILAAAVLAEKLKKAFCFGK